MNYSIDIEDFLKESKEGIIIDVRTPAEYEEAHIPNAINIPLFSNEERVEVGIRYKHNGKDSAVLLGLEKVGPKLASFVKTAKRIAKNKCLYLYCWRGGMRSNSMAWLFSTSGLQVRVLDGGYKNYRSHIRENFSKAAKLVILGGMTGSGKTEILLEMEKRGEQVIDLEGIANHKGSVFGALGQYEQPSSEQFENNLAERWNEMDLTKPIWLEDESNSIGSVWINHVLFKKMRESLVIKIEMPMKYRLERLVKEYAVFGAEKLASLLSKIERRLGGQNLKLALDLLKEENYEKVAEISLRYYDKAYNHGIEKRDPKTIKSIDLENNDAQLNAEKIIKFYRSL
ncbi:MAG: tRNA 2-selenouridine(34) synthase MnmH [Marinifilaceae bacterium]|jgi:tRNA 2-selenouridine synthase|nr:tRNA 2-selenouridine(34) synthase MnmH [Marinifilaceae bacterium]